MSLINTSYKTMDPVAQNQFIHKYVIAANHAFLWIAALSLAGFAHLSSWFDSHEALLLSTLVAYCAYLCESGLGTWRVATSQSLHFINFRKAAMWKWIWLNVAVNICLSCLFLLHPSWVWIMAVIFTAGWQKYIDGRIPPRIQATMIPISGNTFKAKAL